MIEKIVDFKKYSSIKIGGIKKLKIAQTINEALILSKTHVLLGKASNTLISPDAKNLFCLGDEFDYIKENDDFIEIGAKSSARKAFLYFREQNLKGAELLGSIPGSIGGVIKMNAGIKEYEIKDSIVSVNINGEWIESNNIDFSYRHSNIDGVIIATRFKKEKGFRFELEDLFKDMRKNQPKEPSLGSCFKNPKEMHAGKLLDISNLKGFKIGDMAFSKKHANFMVNLGNGNFDDAIKLINLAQNEIYEKHKIALKTEIIIIKGE
ncbi:UDP-N-acetylmuramate dehydrogenase [Helicobacter sp. MIT 99-5507]|uniref:UDP-N-acetylmuramate dehydrogenase n=1 Tax=Helicobacter sp. MIT 99-5507 TaxID=152489 RepID=UPI000E1F5F92|nr:UDP-N-acetylmuramate dehydrogenase [Helicobacter sp. MIT 99-5507]RDU57419.1 UDP-N-acetylmuramate dehydrogenase [Helicobacter sp. MIT 99-5507]